MQCISGYCPIYASIFIDIGHMKPSVESTETGLSILNEHKNEIIEQIGSDSYFYNLGNAKSNLVCEKKPFKQNFSTIEQPVEVKTDLWKAIKFSGDSITGKGQDQ